MTAVQDVPSIEETARLFVRNLPYSTTEADLAEVFREHGEVLEAHLVLDRWPHALTAAAYAHSSALCITIHKKVMRSKAGLDLVTMMSTVQEGSGHRGKGWQALQDHQEEQGHCADPICGGRGRAGGQGGPGRGHLPGPPAACAASSPAASAQTGARPGKRCCPTCAARPRLCSQAQIEERWKAHGRFVHTPWSEIRWWLHSTEFALSTWADSGQRLQGKHGDREECLRRQLCCSARIAPALIYKAELLANIVLSSYPCLKVP